MNPHIVLVRDAVAPEEMGAAFNHAGVGVKAEHRDTATREVVMVESEPMMPDAAERVFAAAKVPSRSVDVGLARKPATIQHSEYDPSIDELDL